jgi:hypothetical protein
MFGMCWSGQTLGKSVSDHEIGAKGHKLDHLLSD